MMDNLLDRNILIANTELIKLLGFELSIILRRLAYELSINEDNAAYKKDSHYRDGRWWHYDTYENWVRKTGEGCSVRTMKRLIKELEELGLVLSRDDMNRSSMDRTKWYTIDYEAYAVFMSMWKDRGSPSIAFDPEGRDAFLAEWASVPKWHDRECQNGTLESANLSPAIPKDSNTKDSEEESMAGAVIGADAPLPTQPRIPAQLARSDFERLREMRVNAEKKSAQTEKKDIGTDHPLVQLIFRATNTSRLDQHTADKLMSKIRVPVEGGGEQEYPCLIELWDTQAGFDEYCKTRVKARQQIEKKEIIDRKNLVGDLRNLTRRTASGNDGWLGWREKNKMLTTTSEPESPKMEYFEMEIPPDMEGMVSSG